MSCNDLFVEADALKGTTVVLMSRFYNAEAVALTQADTASVRVDVYDATTSNVYAVDSTGTEVTDGTAYDTPTAAEVVSDTLNTADARWTKDSVGFNVLYKFVPPKRDRLYEVRLTVTTVGGDPLGAAWKVKSK